jgi:hypothetical protein
VTCSRLLLAVAMAAVSASASAEDQEPPPVPVCIYNSKSFSDGAHICFQKYLMMICSTDNNRPVWKIVTDKELNRFCLNPINVSDE